jgi:hypothetical protein
MTELYEIDAELFLAIECAADVLAEEAPDAPGAEEWIMKHKDEFKKRYGQSWAHVLYGKAWHIFGKNAVNRKSLREANFDPEMLEEASWLDKYERRSLTREESSRLRVPKDKLQCTVAYFEPKKKGAKGGYIAYTHRCTSGFYDRPEDIPVKKLEFVSSTS